MPENPSQGVVRSQYPMHLLDLFCGAGGAAAGYARAGFEVTGVDLHPQPRYPFRFIQADALTFPFDGFDIVHASPPCQRFSIASYGHRAAGKQYPDCLTPIRERLRAWGGTWVIENVVGAPMEPPTIMLCGLMFGLKVFRHRLFQCSHMLMAPEHPSHRGKRIGEGYFCVAGHYNAYGPGRIEDLKAAMGIDWMTRQELTQAIAPAYTEWIGKQLIRI